MGAGGLSQPRGRDSREVSGTGIVAALTAEARTLGPVLPAQRIRTLADGNLLVISGMGPQRATHAARALLTAGARSLLSFGLAGALDPQLCAGAVLLPQNVRDETGQVHPTYDPWRERLAAQARAQADSHVRPGGTLLSVAQPLTSSAQKAQAWSQTGASAVDMESFAIASVAVEKGVTFAILRVVVDTATDTLPDSITRATDSYGEVNYARLAAGLMRTPTDLAALLKLARRYRLALHSLRSLGQRGLGFP
jgi:adenosylhomocysteine nucleosidase